MSDKMFMLIEQNKLKDRFEGTVGTAILEVLNQEKDAEHIKHIGRMLYKFNDMIRCVDEAFCTAFGIGRDDREWMIYEEEFHDKYINILLDGLNKLYLRFGKTDFLQQYSKAYWKHTQEFILTLWKELPEGKTVAENESSFIKIFEDFFAETIKKFPDFIVKQLKDFSNLYRASKHKVHDNYKYIMPDPLYCHDNRWNEDGVAYLYLAYDNEGATCQNILQSKRTCFEEIRAKDGEEIAVCKFKPLHRRAKILDLSYDGIDYDKEIREFDYSEIDYKEQIMAAIQSRPKLWNRMKVFAQTGDEEAFKKELEKVEGKLGLDQKLHDLVQMQLSKVLIGNICDAIFYVVDREDDPKLEAYIPFRAFSRYLLSQGFAGVAYRSTRMAKAGLRGKCLTLFNPKDATFVKGEMEVYEYHCDECRLIKKY